MADHEKLGSEHGGERREGERRQAVDRRKEVRERADGTSSERRGGDRRK